MPAVERAVLAGLSAGRSLLAKDPHAASLTGCAAPSLALWGPVLVSTDLFTHQLCPWPGGVFLVSSLLCLRTRIWGYLNGRKTFFLNSYLLERPSYLLYI